MNAAKIINKNIALVKQHVLLWGHPLREVLCPRKFQAYCVGTGKTGTHSLEGIFQNHYRTDHEPESGQLVDMILAEADGKVDFKEKSIFIHRRDKRLWLELESSFLLFYFLDVLVQDYPEAKFILTIRDCYSWLDSFINHRIARPPSDKWIKMSALRYGTYHEYYAKEEEILAKHGFYSLAAYFAGWANHNKTVLATIPTERLLVVRTDEIDQKTPEIAAFLEIPIEHLDDSKSHLFKARQRTGILHNIDNSFLEAQVNRHCRGLMDQFFPELHCFEDAFDE